MKLIPAALTVALLAAGTAFAQPPPGPPTPAMRGDRMSQIGLSPEQSRKLREVLKQFGQKMRELEKTLSERRKALEGQFRQYDLDAGQARQLNKQINSVQKDILDEHLQFQLELRKILTSEQFARMRQGMERRRPQDRRSPNWQRPPK